jgi:hypothetical protein
LLQFPSIFTRAAPDAERERLQALLGNLPVALGTASVPPLVQPHERLVDASHRPGQYLQHD